MNLDTLIQWVRVNYITIVKTVVIFAIVYGVLLYSLLFTVIVKFIKTEKKDKQLKRKFMKDMRKYHNEN